MEEASRAWGRDMEVQTAGPLFHHERAAWTGHTRDAGYDCDRIQWALVRTLKYSAFAWGEKECENGKHRRYSLETYLTRFGL